MFVINLRDLTLHVFPPNERAVSKKSLIPNPIDQNPWAHWRSPMDMMRQG
jgi:hypothetical protein